jgi:hypothetical protein
MDNRRPGGIKATGGVSKKPKGGSSQPGARYSGIRFGPSKTRGPIARFLSRLLTGRG